MHRFFDKQTLRMMRPYLVVVSVCLFLCASVGLYVLRQLETSVMASSEYMTSLVQSTADRRLEELSRYTLTLELNSANVWLKSTDTMPAHVPAPVYRMQDTIRDFVDSNLLARDIYIYYPEPDFTVGSLGCFSAGGYRALQTHPGGQADGDAWAQRLLAVTEPTFLLDQRPDGAVLCYVRPQCIGRDRQAVAVVEISPDTLIEIFSQAQAQFPEAFQISLLMDGQVVASEGDTVADAAVNAMFARWQGGTGGMLMQGDTAAYFSPSQLSGLYYASFYQTGRTMHTVRTTILLCAGCAVLTLAIGLVGTLLVSRRSMKPIRTMLTKLGEGENREDDAYQLLEARIDALMQANQQSEQRIFAHQTLLDATFFTTLLRGELRSEAAVMSAANRYGVVFSEPVFQVLALSNEARTIPAGEGWRQILYDQLVQVRVPGLGTVFSGRICVLLNADAPYPDAFLQTLCKALLDALYPDEPAAAGIGTACDSLTAILTSYHCARRALLACPADAAHPCRVYTPDLAQGHHGDTRVMQRFSGYMYQRQYGQARQMLDQLCEEYLGAGVVPAADLMRQQAVTSLLADAAGETLSDGDAAEIVRSLSAPQPPAAYRRLAASVLERLEKAQLRTAAEETRAPVAARAKLIVDETFTDPMMGLYLVSEQLNVSNSYLSTAFKNAYGVSLVQYLNRLRVDHAKKLIVDTSMSIKEIALASGFSSDIHFIRVFKKQENKTPTMLRRESAAEPAAE